MPTKTSNARWQLELASCDLRSLLCLSLPDILTQGVYESTTTATTPAAAAALPLQQQQLLL